MGDIIVRSKRRSGICQSQFELANRRRSKPGARAIAFRFTAAILVPAWLRQAGWPLSGMAKIYDAIDSDLEGWILQQKMFFVATAPLDAKAHVNCSPKGGDSFRVLNKSEVAYLDFTGSGIETVAHLQENGRIVVMFCAFEGAPKIVRLHGRGQVLYPDSNAFQRLIGKFPAAPGIRAIVRIQISRISDSCGFSVPLYEFVAYRDTFAQWAAKKGEGGLADYRRQKNRSSIDELAGYKQGDLTGIKDQSAGRDL